jgi:hypothetical protein
VTPNFHAALLRLRDPVLPRILWIDAICINSGDNEKSQQIQIMARIYGVASRVLVWLGEAADDSDEAIEAIRTARRGLKRFADGSVRPEAYINRHHCIDALLRRSWFRRILVRH